MPSPPKPWERAGAAAQAGPAPTPSPAISSTQAGPTTTTTTTTSIAPPAIPVRPASINNAATNASMVNRPGFGTGTGYGTSTYGTGYGSTYGGGGAGYGTTYGGGGYGQSYSPYNRYGYGSNYGSTYGSTYGNSYSPYSRYGGYGNGYSTPYNRFSSPYGPGGPGPGGPGEMPLSAQMEQSTQATFNTLDQIVQAFAGFSQMLESTFMATHSSFMAMVGVAEQFGTLRTYLGQVFSLVSLYRTLRRFIFRMLGRPAPVDTAQLNPDEFKSFETKEKRSKRPIWVFLFFTVGIPWVISKLFQRLQKQRLEAAATAAIEPSVAAAAGLVGPDGRPLQASQIKDLEFCRAAYDFVGEAPGELSLKKGEIVAILSKLDPATGQEGMWWRGRLQNGNMGMFPSNYVEMIQKKPNIGSPSHASIPVTPSAPQSSMPTSVTPHPDLNPASFNPDALGDLSGGQDFGPMVG